MTASDFDHAYGFLLTRGRSPYMRRLWGLTRAFGRRAATVLVIFGQTASKVSEQPADGWQVPSQRHEVAARPKLDEIR